MFLGPAPATKDDRHLPPLGRYFFFVSGRNHKLRHRKLRYGGITEIMTDGQVQTGPDAPGDSAYGASPELVKTNVASPGHRTYRGFRRSYPGTPKTLDGLVI